MTKDQLERRIDELYADEPSSFVARRNALVHELATEKQTDDKKRVHDLRRPTVAAWVVNRLFRERRAELDELMTAGAELREAQQALLDGKGSSAFAAASERERKATSRLLDEARQLLRSHGAAPAVELHHVAATLRALARDSAASAAFDGRLPEALEPPGFDSVLQMAAEANGPRTKEKPLQDAKGGEDGTKKGAKKDEHQERLRQDAERRELQRLEREDERHRALERARTDAQSLLQERRLQAEQSQRDADAADQQATTAAERVHEVERMLREARAEEQRAVTSAKQVKVAAEAAVAEVRQAQDKLDQIERQLSQIASYGRPAAKGTRDERRNR